MSHKRATKNNNNNNKKHILRNYYANWQEKYIETNNKKKLLSSDVLQIVILTHFMIRKNKHPMRVSATATQNQGIKYIQVPFCKYYKNKNKKTN